MTLLVLAALDTGWALNSARIIEISGTPSEAGNITITIGSESLQVSVIAGMTCEELCQAVKDAADMEPFGSFWHKAQIDCLHNGYCYLRIRDGRDDHIGDHLGEPDVEEDPAPVLLSVELRLMWTVMIRPMTFTTLLLLLRTALI